jgi:hypothetical protein
MNPWPPKAPPSIARLVTLTRGSLFFLVQNLPRVSVTFVPALVRGHSAACFDCGHAAL